jgi:hypothetical protein
MAKKRAFKAAILFGSNRCKTYFTALALAAKKSMSLVGK